MNGELSGYLGYSQYGTKGEKVEQNTSESYYTGGSNTKKIIYTDNKKQSTTYNATGVYDMNGGAYEYVASYLNNNNGNLTKNGGDQTGDLCDNTGTKREESTAYKTVYAKGSSDEQSANYEANAGKKGDAVYETSGTVNSRTGSWFSAYAYFPFTDTPFFDRGGHYSNNAAGTFYFDDGGGGDGISGSFRPMLAF